MITHTTDVCVIGTGPGGAVVGAHAAASGRETLLLERGGFYNADHFTHHETSVVSRVFKDGGLQTTDSFDFYILQGQCVGGSAILSNAVAFRLPEQFYRRWVDEFGFAATRDEMRESYERVETSSSVRKVEEHAFSPGTWKFLEGCKKLGLPEGTFDTFNKAIKDCVSCGLCNSCCPYERKRTVNLTYIPHAIKNGAKILTYAEAWKFRRKGGKVTELLVRRWPKDDKKPHWERIVANTFVLSGGAINSPAVLLRSKIGPNAGKFTSFNAGVTLLGEWDEVVDAHTGDDMCAYYSPEDYLFTCESTINPPGAVGLFIPGFFEDHYNRMGRYRHLVQVGCLFPAEPVARVKWTLVSRFLKHEFVSYKMPPEDEEKARRALIAAGKILFAGGAKRIFLPFVVPTVAESVETLEPLVRERFTTTDALNSMGSAHPFGGCRVSKDKRTGTVDPQFRVYGTENLYVADASVFPTAVAVNPMLTIMAVSDHIATRVLGYEPVTLDFDPPVPELPESARSRVAAGTTAKPSEASTAPGN